MRFSCLLNRLRSERRFWLSFSSLSGVMNWPSLLLFLKATYSITTEFPSSPFCAWWLRTFFPHSPCSRFCGSSIWLPRYYPITPINPSTHAFSIKLGLFSFSWPIKDIFSIGVCKQKENVSLFNETNGWGGQKPSVFAWVVMCKNREFSVNR